MSLEEELTEINGVGDATAEKIMAIVDEYEGSDEGGASSGDANRLMERALDEARAGNDREAAMFLRRVDQP